MVLSILVELEPNYFVFISTFHATKTALKTAYKMPSLENFDVLLTREQYKIMQMGPLKKSKSHALYAKPVKSHSSTKYDHVE